MLFFNNLLKLLDYILPKYILGFDGCIGFVDFSGIFTLVVISREKIFGEAVFDIVEGTARLRLASLYIFNFIFLKF
jgi:hypothetical protein